MKTTQEAKQGQGPRPRCPYCEMVLTPKTWHKHKAMCPYRPFDPDKELV